MGTRVILSGMRPTGRLHIGNYVGALMNWIRLQNEAEAQCYFMVADWHALTTDYEDPSQVESNIEAMVMDWLSCGLNPEKVVLFRQSWISEHAELALILSMITPLSWLERNPTYKEQINTLKDKAISTHGFLGYPVLQAADILLYGATHVPVGEDQLPHLELTREIARRFNFLYKKSVLTEPQALLSPVPKVLGMDGRKMSKSYGNTVYITEEEKELSNKIRCMFTDPHKVKMGDRGHPNPCPDNPTGCMVFQFHKMYEDSKNAGSREKTCMEGTLGCSPCKKDLYDEMNAALKIFREKRKTIKKEQVAQLLKEGSEMAQKRASETLRRVKDALGYR